MCLVRAARRAVTDVPPSGRSAVSTVASPVLVWKGYCQSPQLLTVTTTCETGPFHGQTLSTRRAGLNGDDLERPSADFSPSFRMAAGSYREQCAQFVRP